MKELLAAAAMVHYLDIVAADLRSGSRVFIFKTTSPTASGKGLRRLAQCVWMAGCDCRVVFFWIQL